MALQKSLNRTACAMMTFLFLLLVLFLNPFPALAGNSNSGCRYECKFIKVTLDKKNSNRSSYHIRTQCSWKVYGNAACPPGGPDTFIGAGWWDEYLGMAHEEIQFTGSYHVKTLAKCTSNPWLGSWVDCTEIQRDIVIDNHTPLPDYTPVSAKLMSYANKQELQQEENLAISKIQAPHIQRPVDNIIFGRVNNVPIIIDHLKEYKLAYEFQHRDSPDKPFRPLIPGDLYPFEKPSPKGSGQYVITAVAFYPKTRGYFRVRARCGENSVGWGIPVELSEWSDWTAFSIDEPPRPSILTPGNGRQFDLSDQVLIETEHDENFPVTFSFTRKDVTSGPMSTGTHSIVPLTENCSSAARDGVESISCYYTFDKTGEYTFSVKLSGTNTLPVTRTFKMTQQGTKTIKSIPSLTFKPPEIHQPAIDGLKVKLHSPVKVTGSTSVSKMPVPVPSQKLTKSPGSTVYPVTLALEKKRFTNPKAVELVLNNPSGKKLVFDFQYKEKGGFFRHVSKAPVVVLNHAKGKSVVTLKGLRFGDWRVRTRTVTSGCPWSRWQTFSVVFPVKKTNDLKSLKKSYELHKKMNKLMTPPVISKPTKNKIIYKRYKVTFQIRHSKGSKLFFEFEYRKKKGTGLFRPYSVNVSSLKTSHSMTGGAITFTKDGEYRFRVREVKRDDRWSEWRIFTMKTGVKGNIKKQHPRKPAIHRTSAGFGIK